LNSLLKRCLNMKWVIVIIFTMVEAQVTHIPRYSYQYEVRSNNGKDKFGLSELRDGYKTVGKYQVILPDGRNQVVDYWVSGKNSGYKAKVSYQQTASQKLRKRRIKRKNILDFQEEVLKRTKPKLDVSMNQLLEQVYTENILEKDVTDGKESTKILNDTTSLEAQGFSEKGDLQPTDLPNVKEPPFENLVVVPPNAIKSDFDNVSVENHVQKENTKKTEESLSKSTHFQDHKHGWMPQKDTKLIRTVVTIKQIIDPKESKKIGQSFIRRIRNFKRQEQKKEKSIGVQNIFSCLINFIKKMLPFKRK